MSLFKSLVKAPFSWLGLDLQRRINDPVEVLLRQRRFRTVLDIGADVGNFSAKARRALPQAQIYGFEPLPDSFHQLQERFRGDSSFTAFQTAIGDKTGEINFFQDDFAVASSALPHSGTSKKTFSQVGRTLKIQVPIHTLDGWAQDNPLVGPVLMKLDVQGYEKPVILGGSQVMKNLDAIIVEVCFLELYQGQALFCDIHTLLTDLGFSLLGIHEEAPHRVTGLSMYADAYYRRLST